jgi:SAM-dependent methyltransferase
MDVLGMLYQYDSFLDSLKVIADMGCGSGLDSKWWAELMTRDDPPVPHKYLVYAVDRDTSKIDPKILADNKNINVIQHDFETVHLPRKADLVWSHDSFQYCLNPLKTLAHWNHSMNQNGMLVLNIPMHTTYSYDRLQTRAHSGSFYTYNICNLMYMLAVNGFDCRDCYIYMAPNYGWIHFAVYKSFEAFDPATTSLFDLADKNLLSDSAMDCLNKYGHLRQEELRFIWLDKDWRLAKN